MKKYIKALLLSFIVCMLTITLAACRPHSPIDGGWKETKDGVITEELSDLFQRAFTHHTGATYRPLRLLATQLVSGTNYRFLCEKHPATIDAAKSKVIVTIYEDLEGHVSVTDITDEDDATVQIPNPYINADTMAEAEAGANFTFHAPDALEGFQGRALSYIKNEMIQVIYGDADKNLYLRKGKGDKDLSGDYNDYEIIDTFALQSNQVTVKGHSDGVYTAIWHKNHFSYALTSSTPLTKNDIKNIIRMVDA